MLSDPSTFKELAHLFAQPPRTFNSAFGARRIQRWVIDNFFSGSPRAALRGQELSNRNEPPISYDNHPNFTHCFCPKHVIHKPQCPFYSPPTPPDIPSPSPSAQLQYPPSPIPDSDTELPDDSAFDPNFSLDGFSDNLIQTHSPTPSRYTTPFEQPTRSLVPYSLSLSSSPEESPTTLSPSSSPIQLPSTYTTPDLLLFDSPLPSPTNYTDSGLLEPLDTENIPSPRSSNRRLRSTKKQKPLSLSPAERKRNYQHYYGIREPDLAGVAAATTSRTLIDELPDYPDHMEHRLQRPLPSRTGKERATSQETDTKEQARKGLFQFYHSSGRLDEIEHLLFGLSATTLDNLAADHRPETHCNCSICLRARNRLADPTPNQPQASTSGSGSPPLPELPLSAGATGFDYHINPDNDSNLILLSPQEYREAVAAEHRYFGSSGRNSNSL